MKTHSELVLEILQEACSLVKKRVNHHKYQLFRGAILDLSNKEGFVDLLYNVKDQVKVTLYGENLTNLLSNTKTGGKYESN